MSVTRSSGAPSIDALEPRRLLSGAARRAADRADEIDYLKFVAMHHTLGVQMAEIAANKATSDLLRQQGENAAADQAKETKQVLGWLKDWYGVKFKPTVDKEGQKTLDTLDSYSGAVFDVQFSQTFIGHHQEIVLRSLDEQDNLFHGSSRKLAQHIGQEQGREISDLGKVLQQYPRETDFAVDDNKVPVKDKRRNEINYLKFVAMHHTTGVAMADIADDKATLPFLKRLAADAKADQASEIRYALRTLRDKFNVNFTPTIDAEGQKTLKALREFAVGEEFDKGFSQIFSMHHADIIAVSNSAIDKIRTDATESLAEHIIQEQGREIGDMSSVLLAYA